jgi:sugar O-acyltransferase (sialic acid O-acetyltransferase NeuD family)
MTAEPIVVVGAGGFGREVIDIIDAINASAGSTQWNLVGVVDDAPSEVNLARLSKRGVEFLGATDEPLRWLDRVSYTVGVGSPRARRSLAEKYDGAGLRAATLVHPTVTRGSDVRIGDGSVLCAGVRLTTNIGLGRHVHLNLNATVGHDTTLGDYVSVNPLASVSGDCSIESGVLIGVAGVILNGLTVGANSTVGGSACVVRSVPSNVVVKGIPAR